MTGKTHLTISAAVTATTLLAAGLRLRTPGSVTPASARDVIVGEHVLAASSDIAQGVTAWSTPALWSLFALMLVGVAAGLFPDLDAPQSELRSLPQTGARRLAKLAGNGRSGASYLARTAINLVAIAVSAVINLLSGVIRQFTGHRGFTHTAWGAFLFTCIASLVTFLITSDVRSALAFGGVWFVGYASHLLADACTPAGIPLLWGLPRQLIRRSRQGGPAGKHYRPPALASQFAAQQLNGLPYGSKPRPQQAPPMFHLLPRRMLVLTGTWPDTMVIRWCALFITVVALAFIAA